MSAILKSSSVWTCCCLHVHLFQPPPAAVLVLYLKYFLRWGDDFSTTIYHTFVALCYLTPILGAIIADSWLGKFKYVFILPAKRWTFDLKGSKMNVQSWGRSLLLNFLLGFLPLVYLISRCAHLFNSSLPALPPPSVQDYCIPVHRLHAGTGGPVSECYPWHHRHKQGWRPWQHGLPRVSRTNSDRTAEVRMQMFTDTLWFPPLELCPCWVWPWLPWEQGASNPAWQPLEETSFRTTRYEVTPYLDNKTCFF